MEHYSANSLGAYGGSSKRFRLSKSYKLKLTNLEIVDQLTIELFQIGADNVYIQNLKNKAIAEHEDETMKEALDDAKSKAQKMAEHMGKQLGEVLTISEYPLIGESNGYEPYFRKSVGYGAVSRATAIGPSTIGLRKIHIERTVKVQFKLEGQ